MELHSGMMGEAQFRLDAPLLDTHGEGVHVLVKGVEQRDALDDHVVLSATKSNIRKGQVGLGHHKLRIGP